MNLLEKIIETVSPETALKRHKQRVALAMSGGYTGASYTDRFANYNPGVADADGDTMPNVRELRGRSRDLVRNNPIAGGALHVNVASVIGTGLTLHSRIDNDFLGMTDEQASEWQSNVEREFRLWCESEFADASQQSNFYELQKIAYRSYLESGDCFVLLANVDRRDWPYSLAIQLIEADRVCNENFAADSDEIVGGIRRGAFGAPVSAFICNRHPGSRYVGGSNKWTEVPFFGKDGRRNLIHLCKRLRPGQTRGVPILSSVIPLLKQIGRYSDAEVDAAVNSAAMAVFTQMDADAFQDIFNDAERDAILNNAGSWDGTLTGSKSGKVINLMPGESIETATMTRPNPNFEGFVNAVMTQIGMALNIPYEVLLRRFNSSYSASRAALLEAWRNFRIDRDWFSQKFCQAVYEEWLAEAIGTGRVIAPGFYTDARIRKAWSSTKWAGDGPGSINPLEEARAARERMDIGLTTLAEEIVSYDGGDWEQKHKQQVVERHEREEAGLVAPVVPPVGMGAPNSDGGAPTNAPEPGEDNTEDTADKGAEAIQNAINALQAAAQNSGHHNIVVPAPVVTIHNAAPTMSLNVPDQPAPVVNVAAPVVSVEAPVVNVPAPVVSVEAPNVSVSVPEPTLTVNAIMPARKTVTDVVTDDEGNIVKTIQTETDLEK